MRVLTSKPLRGGAKVDIPGVEFDQIVNEQPLDDVCQASIFGCLLGQHQGQQCQMP